MVTTDVRRPGLTAARATAAAREFGIDGTARELGSQQDQNFRVDGATASYVLKVASPDVDVAELDLQNRAMEHLARALPGQVPLPLRTLDGREIVRVPLDGTSIAVRLLSYLPGVPLRGAGYLAPEVLDAVGSLAGRTSLALASFAHPAADRALAWDVRRAGEVVARVAPGLLDGSRRDVVERTADRAAHALAALGPSLPRQVVHGDISDWNVVGAADDVGRLVPSGLIDFGDVVSTWRAAECAVTAVAFAARPGGRVVQDAARVVRAFCTVAPLTEDELAALPALMAARAALSAALCAHQTEHRTEAEPRDAYLAAGASDGWHRLLALADVPFPLAHAAFRRACGLPPLAAPAVPRPPVAGPVVPDLDGRTAVPVDLSVVGDVRAARRERLDAERAVEDAASSLPSGYAVGRYGEARRGGREGQQDEPATAHLGIDVFLAVGTTVHAPVAGRVAAARPDGLLLEVDGAVGLRLAGLEPGVASGQGVGRGDLLGRVAPAGPDAPLPAHLHVQVVPASLADAPGHAVASLAQEWLGLCPDPGPLLGLDSPAASAPRPDPATVLARRRRYVASPQLLYYADDPPQVERGWRQWLYDVWGRGYLDVVNNVAVVGHSHPRVEAAAARQLRLLNTNSRFLYDAMGRFAERLVGLVPAPLDVVFLLSSGSEANDLALRLAREVTGRRDVLCFEGTYHGWTSATIETERTGTGAPPDGARAMHPILRPGPGQEAAARSLEHARHVLESLDATGRLPAGLICEPVLGNEGGIVLPPGHLQQLYAAVRAAGGLCIADEVQVGYGRLGEHFWAFEQQQVVPDIVTIAKATGNGYPVAAVITSRGIADAFGRHDDLFASVGGSAVACEVGLAVLDVLAEERLQDNARDVGRYATERLDTLAREHPLVGEVRGLGLYRGVELAHGEPPGPATALARAVCARMRELGVFVQPTGDARNVLKVKPPLCVTTDDIDLFVAALQRTLATGW